MSQGGRGERGGQSGRSMTTPSDLEPGTRQVDLKVQRIDHGEIVALALYYTSQL